jgi:hypothetical protein
VIVAVPNDAAVTRPVLETVATAGLLEDHAAVLLTFWVVLSDRFAVAVSWLV